MTTPTPTLTFPQAMVAMNMAVHFEHGWGASPAASPAGHVAWSMQVIEALCAGTSLPESGAKPGGIEGPRVNAAGQVEHTTGTGTVQWRIDAQGAMTATVALVTVDGGRVVVAGLSDDGEGVILLSVQGLGRQLRHDARTGAGWAWTGEEGPVAEDWVELAAQLPGPLRRGPQDVLNNVCTVLAALGAPCPKPVALVAGVPPIVSSFQQIPA